VGTARQERQRAAAVTRQLRLLRAHGLLRKVSGTHRYVVTENGRKILTALLAARQADVEQLTALAA
jgi:DNA-binding MarR family transcriptional regulator